MTLTKKIEIKRQQMLDLASKYGLTFSETVQCSQELDKLILVQIKNSFHYR